VIDLFGYVEKDTIPAGVHLKTLFASSHIFSLKTQLFEVSQDAPTSEGLIVELDVSVLFRLNEKDVVTLYTTVGTNYRDILVKPEVTSAIRGLTSKYTAKTLYSAGRGTMATGISTELNEKLSKRGITIEQALLRKVVLPSLVTAAIEEKLKAEQEAQKMEFILAKETSEAERKSIEAKGIAQFQTIVSEGISPQLLEWKGIEATEVLAHSANAKVIVIGNPKNGLPLIFGANSDGPERRDTYAQPNLRGDRTSGPPPRIGLQRSS
jgi:regulator of protease activity HflC (stomatin/prohibitin superfamily)